MITRLFTIRRLQNAQNKTQKIFLTISVLLLVAISMIGFWLISGYKIDYWAIFQVLTGFYAWFVAVPYLSYNIKRLEV